MKEGCKCDSTLYIEERKQDVFCNFILSDQICSTFTKADGKNVRWDCFAENPEWFIKVKLIIIIVVK